MMGYEKLLLQGIPFSRLLLGPETEVQLSDLAGNAVSVCASLVFLQYCLLYVLANSSSSSLKDERPRRKRLHAQRPLCARATT